MGLPTLHAVPFHGDSLPTFEHQNERWVALRPVVEALGLDWSSQRLKLANDGGRFNCGDITTVAADGKQRQMLSIPLRRFPGWLATVNPNKIPDPLRREKVILYQDRSYDALYDFWFKGAAFRDDLDGIVTGIDPKVMASLGGLVKGIVLKALRETIPGEVHRMIGEQQFSVVPGWTAGDVVKEVTQETKGLKGLARVVSYALRRYHAQKGVAVRLGQLGTASAYIFEPSVCREWLALGGKALIIRYVEQKRGSGGLFQLVPTG